MRKPNILFIFSDEHRWCSMQHTSMPELHTPNMTRLAREGTEFQQCISNYPVCSPYRGILLSGRWPQTTGVIDNGIALKPEGPRLGQLFLDAGYRTGYIGKWHLGGNRAEPFGFETSLIWTNTDRYFDTSVYHPAEGKPVQLKGYNPTLMTDQAVAYMKEHQADPFFLAVSLNPPHARFDEAPEEFKARYPQGSLSFRENGDGSQPGNFHKGWEDYQGYHAHIAAMDVELGRLIDAVKDLGLSEDTILIYTSDHGSLQGSHGAGSKRQPYEESIRVPFLAHAPGRVPAGVTHDGLLGTIDLMPTLCGLADIPAPTECPGQDRSSWILGTPDSDELPESQFIMHIAKNNATHSENHPAPIFRGIRTATHTYAVLESGERWLFDNSADEYQVNNLAQKPGQDERIKHLHTLLVDWLTQTQDDFVVHEPIS